MLRQLHLLATRYSILNKARLSPTEICCQRRQFRIRPSRKDDRNQRYGESSDKNRKLIGHRTVFGLTLFATTLLPNMNRDYNQNSGKTPLDGMFITWQDFCAHLLSKGEVARIYVKKDTPIVQVHLHNNPVINGQLRPSRMVYLMQVPKVENFERRVREFEKSLGIRPENGVPIIYTQGSPVLAIALSAFVAIAIIQIFRNIKFITKSSMPGFTKAKFTLVNPTSRAKDSSGVKFKDVAGLKEAKMEVMEFVDYLKNSERFLKLGAKLPKGALLTGPPGCGKTLLAKAVANEANVPFLALSGSDFVEMIGGVGASRVRSLFKSAKKMAPCIIYIDEIDSIGKRRGGIGSQNSEREQTLNQLLVEMDGMHARKGIIILASTNRAEVLDRALVRPGRFDRQIYIDLPDVRERRDIIEKYLSKIKIEEHDSELPIRIARMTPGMSGADLANLCNEAAIYAAGQDKKVVQATDLEYAVDKLLGGAMKKHNSISPQERKVIAYHECGHVLIGWMLEHSNPLVKVSIVPRTNNQTSPWFVPNEDKLLSQEQLFDQMCMALGGRSAELIAFNHLSTNAEDDLKKVTKIALAQVKEYGFDPTIGHLSFPTDDSSGASKRPYSKALAAMIDHRASILVKEAFEKTHGILKGNVDKLNLLAGKLIEKEVLYHKDVTDLIGPSLRERKLNS